MNCNDNVIVIVMTLYYASTVDRGHAPARLLIAYRPPNRASRPPHARSFLGRATPANEIKCAWTATGALADWQTLTAIAQPSRLKSQEIVNELARNVQLLVLFL